MNLPAGITNNLETFEDEHGQLRAMHSGVNVAYFDLPDELRAPFRAELAANKPAQIILRKFFHCLNLNEMEEQYMRCRYGAFDHTPDLAEGITSPDAPQCSLIQHCPGYGVICHNPVDLTRKEYQVTKLAAVGKENKEIAEELGISLNTVITHMNRIRTKFKVNNRVEVSFLARNFGII